MLTRSAIFFPLVMAVLFALITFWISLSVEEQGIKIDGSNRHDPDYSMKNFVTTQTNITGALSHILAATEMTHYPDDDSTVLQRPRYTQYSTNKPYTQIEALRGYVSSNGEQIELVDNVKVVREGIVGKGEMQVLTEKLTLFPSDEIAKTDSPVVITQAPKTVIHATGMIYDKKNQTVQLFNRVKAHYEKPAKQKAITAPTKQDNTKATKAKSNVVLPLTAAKPVAVPVKKGPSNNITKRATTQKSRSQK